MSRPCSQLTYLTSHLSTHHRPHSSHRRLYRYYSPTESRLFSPRLPPATLSATVTSEEPQERSTGTCIVPFLPAGGTYSTRLLIRHTARISTLFRPRFAKEQSLLRLLYRRQLAYICFCRNTPDRGGLWQFPITSRKPPESTLYLHYNPLSLPRTLQTRTSRSSTTSR